MDSLENLLILYTGLILLNVVVSAAMWIKQKTEISKQLFIVWLSTMAVLFFAGTMPQNNFLIILGFSLTFFINMSLAYFLSLVVEFKFPRRPFYTTYVFSLLVAAIFFALKSPFQLTALPVTFAVASPLIYATVKMFRGHWRSATFSEKTLTIIFLLFAAHNVDFAFLRTVESAASFGFTVATLLVFALSMFSTAVVIENVTEQKAKYAAEMDLAHRIQMEILPKDACIPGYELACFMQPAEVVGGDYYDVYSFGEDAWVLFGNVAGNGLGSGLVMFMAQSIVSSILHTWASITPSELNFIANKILCQNLDRLNEQRPMKMLAINLKKSHRFEFSGHHNNVYLYRGASQILETIKIATIPHPLGQSSDVNRHLFSDEMLSLGKDDVLFVGSEGIADAVRDGVRGGERFSEERLSIFLRENANKSLEDVKRLLVAELTEFTGNFFHDDVTFILMRAAA